MGLRGLEGLLEALLGVFVVVLAVRTFVRKKWALSRGFGTVVYVKNNVTRLGIRTALRMSVSEVTSLATDKSRRSELEEIQITLLTALGGLPKNSNRWDAALELLVASVSNLIYSEMQSSKSYYGADIIADAYQVAITRMAREFRRYNEEEFGDPLKFIREYAKYSIKTGRTAAKDAKNLRDEVLLEEEATLDNGSNSLTASPSSPGSEAALFVMEKVCSMAAEAGRREEDFVASPAAYWALVNAGRLSGAAQTASTVSLSS